MQPFGLGSSLKPPVALFLEKTVRSTQEPR
jgi:hypothetical protein